MRLTWSALAVVACLTAAAPTARAQEDADAEARIAFERGATAFASGSYRVALEAFTRSYGLSGRPELLFNIGLAHDRLREDEPALRAFEQYLERVPDAANRAEVEGRVAELRRALADRASSAGADGGSVLGEWWLWAIVGAVVVGAVVAVIVLGGEEQQDPLAGNTGVVSRAVVAW